MGDLRVDSLSVSLGKKEKTEVLHSLSFSFPLGRINVILGPSGSGKTTLLRAILGLEEYSGRILLDGVDLSKIPTKDRNFSYVNQNIALYPHLSLFQNIAFPLKRSFASSSEIRRRVSEASSSLGIEQCLNRRPSQVSLGQCQRASVAKALVKKSELYLFDEPFANVDEVARFSILADFKDAMKKEGASVIYVTHSLREAFFLGDRFLLLEEGKVALSSGREDFLSYADKMGLEI